MDDTRFRRLTEFTAWVRDYIRGDEKGEAQLFLERLFLALGHQGLREAGANLEVRIKKEDQQGTAFADLVWKPVVLVEMKKRGTDLRRHFRQAFDYWTRLVPGRPRYVILCNFDEFWVYDFETQMDSPVDQVRLEELPERSGPLAFLYFIPQKPVFRNNQEEVTREAADRLATCFNKLITRRVERPLAQRFILQILVALFAEDIGLLEEYFVTRLLDECRLPSDAFDLLGGLFAAMNTPGGVSGGRFRGVQYFNGGLFAEPARLELYPDEVAQLRKAAESRWSKVRPEIFGTLFEHSLDHEERHAFGAHFTSHADIMKIVGPTIVEPWRNLIENATSIKRLRELLARMRTYHVLDPACGSGNFLYMAYRELKRLENRAFERLRELSGGEGKDVQRELAFVTAAQFYGIDINPFAVELAKVTMMIARKLAIDELQIEERALPLDNLDGNFLAADALIDAGGGLAPWPQADVIIGNPPFLGAKLLKPERGPDYVNAVRKAFPDVPGMADYCVYWIRRAHDLLPVCTADDPVAGRAGLVGTQNIRNNKSRVGGLDHVVSSGTIVEAVDNQPWSGEANVHVSIVNWVKHLGLNGRLTVRERRSIEEGLLIPEKRRLWFKAAATAEVKKPRKKGAGPANKESELAFVYVPIVNSALSDQADLSVAQAILSNTTPPRCFQGVVTGYSGFVISLAERERLIRADPRNVEVCKPYLIGRDLVTSMGRPSRAVIDFATLDMITARSYDSAFRHVEQTVLPEVQESARRAESSEMGSARQQHLERWWQFWNVRQGMRSALRGLSRYLVCSRVTKRPIFCFVDSSILPDGALQVFAFDDDYSFGVLQSDAHWRWFIANCSKLKADFRYTPNSVFDTFPWPQSPTSEDVESIALAGRTIRNLRADALQRIRGGLREVYRMLELPGSNPIREAHEALNAAVYSAYGFDSGPVLDQLLELNLQVCKQIGQGIQVTAPGAPSICTATPLVSNDRICLETTG